MTMYNQVGFSLSGGQIASLQKAKKNGKAVTLLLKPKQLGGDHDLYLTNTQVKKLSKGAARITFSKTQMKAQKGGFLGSLLAAVAKVLPKVAKFAIPLGLSAASGAISGATHKATSGTGVKKAGTGVKRAGTGVGTLPIHFKKQDIQDFLGVVKKLDPGTCEKCMQFIDRQEGGFLPLIASLVGSLLPALVGGSGLKKDESTTEQL